MEQQLQPDMEMMICKRCKKPTIKRPGKKYCRECSTIINRENSRNYILKNGRVPKKERKNKTLCKCPLCEKLYKRKKINWVGNGIPRIYCDKCLEIVGGSIEPFKYFCQ